MLGTNLKDLPGSNKNPIPKNVGDELSLFEKRHTCLVSAVKIGSCKIGDGKGTIGISGAGVSRCKGVF